MALTKRGKHRYGETQADIRAALVRYSRANTYVAERFADARCSCGGAHFQLEIDDDEGAAVRICARCQSKHPMGDSDEYLENADLDQCECPCGKDTFEVTVGVALYADSADVRWLYIGCRCPSCGLVAVYGDWKNEFEDYKALLARV